MKNFMAILTNVAELAGPVIVFSAVVSILCCVFLRRSGGDRATLVQHVFLVFSFGILGGIAGAVAGSSTESLTGALITGVLGIASALMAYAFDKAATSSLSAVFPYLIFALLLNALVGLSSGQSWRKKWDSYRIELEDYRKEYDGVWVPVTKDMRMKIFEQCRAAQPSYQEVIENCRYDKLFNN